MESRDAWILEDEKRGFTEQDGRWDDCKLFSSSGMLRVQPMDCLGALERETLANMERDGLRDTQFVKSNAEDCHRAAEIGWDDKLLDFEIPETSPPVNYEAVLDSLAGFVRCSSACAYYQRLAVDKGVEFHFGIDGAVETIVKVKHGSDCERKKVTGVKTNAGKVYNADVVVVAGKSTLCHYSHILITCSRILLNPDSSRLELPSRVFRRKHCRLQNRPGRQRPVGQIFPRAISRHDVEERPPG